jgi:hypothetical protein
VRATRGGAPADGTKVVWQGVVLGVQPRIRLTRSFDERQHSYLGFLLVVRGEVNGTARDFRVGVGRVAHEKHRFRAGDRLSGTAVAASTAKSEVADLHRAAAFKFEQRGAEAPEGGPPFLGVPPDLEVYRARVHRRLNAETYQSSCAACRWSCEMPVEMVIDNWGRGPLKYRRETFCYGPKSCPLYRPGPQRKVTGRKGASWAEPDWVDDKATAHREQDD